MFRFRAFRNSDPPALARIWSRQPRQRGLMQPVSTADIEHILLSKLYFDRRGLIVAIGQDDQPVGFVHAGFGPNEAGTKVTTELGVTCMTMVVPEFQESQLGPQLVQQSEAYLRGRGAQVLYAGGIKPLDPFYLGLYGGSELPGILRSDTWQQQLYRRCDYREIDQVTVMHADLAAFRPRISRQQMQHRRTLKVDLVYETGCRNWWDACTQVVCDRLRFVVSQKSGGPNLASAAFWNVEPLASSWGVRVAGLTDLEVAPRQRRQGIATFLLAEAFQQLQAYGSSLVEVQTMQHNTAAIELYRQLNFTEIDQGSVFRKS